MARIFVDTESSVNILFKKTLDQMKVESFRFDLISTTLLGFTGHVVQSLGQIMLHLSLGIEMCRNNKMIYFTVVDAPSSYNEILGRPNLAEFRAVSSTYHQKLKFPVGKEVGVVCGDQKSACLCYVDEVKMDVKKPHREIGMVGAGQGRMFLKEEVQLTMKEEPETVEICLQQNINVLADLDLQTKSDLIACLKTNSDVFAWSAQEVRGVSSSVMEHDLNVLPEA